MNIYFIGMCISMALYIIIGFLISKKVKNANDFYVAGRNAPTLLIVGSLVASYCSTGLFMGDAGEAFGGLYAPVLIVSIIQIVGYVFGSVFFGKYLRRSEVITIPQFFGERFKSKALRILSTIICIITLIVYMLSIMQGIGTLMHFVTGVDYNLCILLALITFTILTVTSGSKGVLITDTIMFGIFTFATIIAIFVIAKAGGGWYNIIDSISVTNNSLLSWSGDLSYLYSKGYMNMIWAFSYGIVWMSVCMVGPWQSSRYLMAKDEHTVVRSSVWAAIGVFFLEFLILIGAVFVRKFNPTLPDSSYSLIWAAMNVLPKLLGVIMLTGVLAAGISSATTFLSLISSSVANDFVEIKDDKKKVRIGRYTIMVSSVIIMLLAYFNPPQIFWIMYLGATVIACSWFPVCIASIWSKKITKVGAFCGMLFGFLGCAIIKIYSSIKGISLPIYLDPFFVGLLCNIVAMIIGTKCSKLTKEEIDMRKKLFIIPEKEKNKEEIIKTRKTLKIFIYFGAVAIIVFAISWVIPYLK